MDDREFETRLRTRLHRRFDGQGPSAELVGAVQQITATKPRAVSVFDLRLRRNAVGWTALLAAGVIAAIAFTGSRLAPAGPGSEQSASPKETAATAWHEFIVLPPPGSVPDKTSASLASDILLERVRTLVFNDGDAAGISSGGGGGYAIAFEISPNEVADQSVRDVLAAVGDVAVVPLPVSYTNGEQAAVVGKPLPTKEPALFGWDGIAGVEKGTDQQGRPIVKVTLRPAAADALATYTSVNVGGSFAVLIDGDVALLPTINAPITDGELQISGVGAPDTAGQAAFAIATAILVGGKLPETWVEPTVPDILQRDELAALLSRDLNGAIIETADLDAIVQDGRWLAVWRVQFDPESMFHSCPMEPVGRTATCAPIEGNVTDTFDAVTGTFISAAPSVTGDP